MEKDWKGLLVVLASFLGCLIVYGTHYSFGILLHPLSEILEVNMGMVSVIGSVQAGCDTITGMFACLLIEMFSISKVYFCGGVLFVSCGLISSFLENYVALVIIFGFFSGIAIGLVNTTCVLAPSIYCPKWKGVACSIVQLGGSCSMIIPILVDLLLSHVKFRTTMITISLIGLVICAISYIFPQKSGFKHGKNESSDKVVENLADPEVVLTTEERRASLIYVGEVENIGRRRSSSTSTSQEIITAVVHEEDVSWLKASTTLMKDPAFVFYLLAFIIYGLVYFLPMMFLFKFIEENGVDPLQAKSIMPIMALASSISRLMIGYLLDQPWMDSVFLQTFCFAVSAAASFVITLCATFNHFLAASILLAIAHNCMYSFATVLLVDVFGLKLLTKTFGILSIGMALDYLLARPSLDICTTCSSLTNMSCISSVDRMHQVSSA